MRKKVNLKGGEKIKKKAVAIILTIVLLALIVSVTPTALANSATEIYVSDVEVGEYSGHFVSISCGLMKEDGTMIGSWDNPNIFEDPQHVWADFLWFCNGWMTWDYPIDIPANSIIKSVKYTVEVSSEAGGAAYPYPSNVQLSINGMDITEWEIPGDPNWWTLNRFGEQENHLAGTNSQYGWLCSWTVDETGIKFSSMFDGLPYDTYEALLPQIGDLGLTPQGILEVKLTVWENGICIYGDTWGDYDFDPTITIEYIPPVPVEVDIKPNDDLNAINPDANGVIPIAILTTADFDASTVDPQTVALEGISARGRGKSGIYGSLEDVDSDGDLDLVVQVVNEITWDENAIAAKLTGMTWDGFPIEGTDSVSFVPLG